MTRTLAALSVAALVAGLGSASHAGDFEGAYVGIGSTAGLIAPIGLDQEWNAHAGYNFQVADGTLVGVEVDAIYNNRTIWLTTYDFTGKIAARGGFLVGDNFFAYGRAGVGYTTGGVGSMLWDVGVGLETFFFENYTARVEFDYVDPFEAGMASQYNVQIGLQYHF